MANDGTIIFEGWGPDLQPGTVTVVTVEDRKASIEASGLAQTAQQGAAAAQAAAERAARDAEEWARSGAGGGSGGGGSAVAPAPTRYASVQHSSAQKLIHDTSGIPVGQWMIAAVSLGSQTVNIVAPAGWLVLKAQTSLGTRRVALFGKIKASGDGGSTEFSKDAAADPWRVVLISGAGALPNDQWSTGTLQIRTSGTAVNTAPSVTTSRDQCLVLVISFEASLAMETGISSVTGAAELYFAAQDPVAGVIETVWVGQIAKPVAGATGNAIITYPNPTSSTNGAALQIVLPPSVSGAGAGGSGGGTIPGVEGLTEALDARWKRWTGTKALYDAIGVKDPGTLYVIVG